MRKIFILLGLLSVLNAQWCVKGSYVGFVCKGIIVESCKDISVDAVKKDDVFYSLTKCHDDVDEERLMENRCAG